jgi:hypothetical protein
VANSQVGQKVKGILFFMSHLITKETKNMMVAVHTIKKKTA